WPPRYGSASRSSATTASWSSASPATTTRRPTSTCSPPASNGGSPSCCPATVTGRMAGNPVPGRPPRSRVPERTASSRPPVRRRRRRADPSDESRRAAWSYPCPRHDERTGLPMATYALIHGAGGDASYWHRVVPELARRGHDVVAPDLPVEDDSAGFAEYADVVVEAIGD